MGFFSSLRIIRCIGPPLGGNRPVRFDIKTSGNSFMKKSFSDLYSGGSSMTELTSSIGISGIGSSISALPTLTYLLRSQVGQGSSFRATGSINRLFSARNGIPNITSCDARGATLKVDGVLILIPLESSSLTLAVICLEIGIGVLDKAWCSRDGVIGRIRSLARCTTRGDTKLDDAPLSAGPRTA